MIEIETWTSPDRVDSLVPLYEAWKEDQRGGIFGISMQMDSYINDIKKCLESMESCIIVALDENEPVGLIMMITIKSEFSDDQVWGVEKGWYVKPRYRSVGGLLIQKAKFWCIDKKCSHMVMSASNLASDMYEKVCRFYTRMGMALFETSFIMEI